MGSRMRCSSGPMLAALAATAMLATIPARASQAECTRDSECKGTRICDAGKCIAPPEKTEAPQGAGVSSAMAWRPAPSPPEEAAQPAVAPPTPAEQPRPEVKQSDTCECAGTVAPHRTGAMHLNEAQIADLKSAGASLDAKEMASADALAERGFSSDEFVSAYRDHRLLQGVYPELARYGSATVDTIAVAHKLALDSDDGFAFVWYRHSRNRTLTEAYNEKILGGPGLLRAGAVTAGAGLALMVVGLELRNIANDHPTYYNYDGNKPDHHFDYPGIAAEIVGGVAALSGIALVTAGLYRWSSWLPPRTLESAPASEVQSMRMSASKPEKPATRWVVLPSLGSQQAGLSLAAAF